MQLCEPITATVILPFIFRLVNEMGVTKGNEDKTGYYSGIIVRSFLVPLDLLTSITINRNRPSISSRLSSSYNGGDYQTRSAANQSC